MGWIVFSVFVFALIPVLVMASRAVRRRAGKREFEADQYNALATALSPAAWIVALALWAVATLLTSVHQVPAGHTGVVYEFGAIVGQTEEGLQIIPPWQSIKNANVQVQTLAFVDEEDKVPEGARRVGQGLDSFSSETQDVFIDAILNIEVSPENIQDLYSNVGPNYVNKLIPGRIAQVFKDETVNYKAVDIAPSREVIRANVEEQLRRELAPFSIDVKALLIETIIFDPAFTDAILQKQVASQEALRQQELVAAERAKADQKIETARGEAERLRVTAEGQAEANRLLNESLTPLLIQFQALQSLGDNVQIALIPSGQGIIIDPANLLGQLPETE